MDTDRHTGNSTLSLFVTKCSGKNVRGHIEIQSINTLLVAVRGSPYPCNVYVAQWISVSINPWERTAGRQQQYLINFLALDLLLILWKSIPYDRGGRAIYESTWVDYIHRFVMCVRREAIGLFSAIIPDWRLSSQRPNSWTERQITGTTDGIAPRVCNVRHRLSKSYAPNSWMLLKTIQLQNRDGIHGEKGGHANEVMWF